MYRPGLYDPFANDPFFADFNTQMRRMNNQYQHMMAGFSGFPDYYPALNVDARNQLRDGNGSNNRSLSTTTPSGSVHPYQNLMSDPFSMMNAMMNNMQQAMSAAHSSQFGNLPSSANGPHSFSSSSFYSYSSDGRSDPRVIEAHAAERRAPGGVRETRRAFRNSETGDAKMAIGHHLDDRGHIIERSENRRTGQREQRNEYQGFDEADAPRFNEEWRERTRAGNRDRSVGYGSHAGSGSRYPELDH